MILTPEEALIRVSERVAEDKRRWDQSLKQRRHQVVDMYGVEYTRVGDKDSPARFYISISPDLVYLERFEFKLNIQPFLSTAGSSTSNATVTVNGTTLNGGGGGGESIDSDTIDDIIAADDCTPFVLGAGDGGGGSGITPNPHTHTTQPHKHSIIPGITLIPTTASDFRVSIEGIDVTAYLMAQYGTWINGEGVYPSLDIGEDYDVLEVASDLVGEGEETKANKLVGPGYKMIEISSNEPFQSTLVLYLKYSHLNR